ncbi:12637_t:CDS:2, partial [Funneliformis mosseae]
NSEKNFEKIITFANTGIKVDLDKEVIILSPLPGTESETRIYKHCCYEYFKNFILQSKKYKRYCITGNPGTGKTFIGRFIMCVLLKEHPYLITRNKKDVFDVEWVQPEYYADVAEREKVWCIIDENDLERCRSLIYPHEFYELCGGIPRIIFKFMLDKIDKMIAASINKVNTNIHRFIETLNEGDDYSHNLIHIYTNNEKMNVSNISRLTFISHPYTFCELKFTSTIIGDKVFAKLKAYYKEETYKFVFASSSVPLLSSIRGYMFEIIAYNELSTDDIEDNKYCKLVAKNFKTIDAIYIERKYDMTFQITVEKSHNIKQHRYDLLYEKLGETTIHSEKEKNGQAKDVVNVRSWIKKSVTQYALLLD